MTDAVIQAEFVQFKQLKSKPIVQLIFEIPVEQGLEAIKTLGLAHPGESTWCAIAKLEKEEQNTP